jgi:hypothetical protein
MFHALAAECADFVVGRGNRKVILRAWTQCYRSLDHGRVKAVCASQNSRIKAAYRRFPDEIRAFGDTFVALQIKRHEADYSPTMSPLLLSEAQGDIDIAEQAISDFRRSNPVDRRAFCVFVLHDLRA